VGPTIPEITAKIKTELFEKFVVPVPFELTKVTGNVQ
jgi:hypothetical protein